MFTDVPERLRVIIAIYLAARHRLGLVPNGEGLAVGPTGGLTFPEMEETMLEELQEDDFVTTG